MSQGCIRGGANESHIWLGLVLPLEGERSRIG